MGKREEQESRLWALKTVFGLRSTVCGLLSAVKIGIQPMDKPVDCGQWTAVFLSCRLWTKDGRPFYRIVIFATRILYQVGILHFASTFKSGRALHFAICILTFGYFVCSGAA
jgi:hypothetical protein